MRKLLKATAVLISVSTLLFIILSNALNCNKPIDEDFILIEDWLASPVLDAIYSDYLKNAPTPIIIPGAYKKETLEKQPKLTPYAKLSKINIDSTTNIRFVHNMFFILTPKPNIHIPEDSISLSFLAKGTDINNINAHFSLFINHKRIKGEFVTSHNKQYYYRLPIATSDNLEITLHFDNNGYVQKEGRSITFSNIKLNGEHLHSDNCNFSFYKSKINQAVKNSYYNCHASITSNYLIDLGVQPQRINYFCNEYAVFNKTYYCANGLKEWTRNHDHEGKKFMIISYDLHGYRTYQNYTNIFDNKSQFGIISYREKDFKQKLKREYIAKLIEEAMGVVYAWIFL